METENQTIARAVEECKAAPQSQRMSPDELANLRRDGVTLVKPVPLPTPARKAQRSTVELLKEMLEEAELGNVVEVVLVGFSAEGNTIVFASPAVAYRNQIAGLEQAKFDIMFAKHQEP